MWVVSSIIVQQCTVVAWCGADLGLETLEGKTTLKEFSSKIYEKTQKKGKMGIEV